MTDLAATADLRDLVRELRDTEFPWTAATTYLNNASIGPIPERTRLALEAGAVVLVSDREFPANVYPWLALADEGITTELVPVTSRGWPDEDRIVERLADPKVRALAVSFVQFANGYQADLARLSAACRANGVTFVVDAIQGLGAAPLDVRQTPVDVLATGGQKWLLSPWGTGYLYVRQELIASMAPAYVGWMSYEGTDDFTNLVNYADRLLGDARRFEVGTLTFQDQLGMRVSLGLLLELGIENIARYTQALADPLLAWCDEHEVRVTSPRDPPHRSSIVCIAPPDAGDVFHQLKRAGVVCALREGSIRLSPHCYNTPDEIGRVIEVLETAIR